MRDLIWRAVARIVTIPAVTDWLIARSKRTPYYPITGPDGSLYMDRHWLFNPYRKDTEGETIPPRWPGLPSIRIHHITRPDSDRHAHDHPWDARTIVLRGWYTEQKPSVSGRMWFQWNRSAGYTGTLQVGTFHRIADVSEGGVWTLFFTWGKADTWGFLVNGRKVPWREYLTPNAPPPRLGGTSTTKA